MPDYSWPPMAKRKVMLKYPEHQIKEPVLFRMAKEFRFGNARFEPTADVFNVFNNNAITNAVQTIGSSLGRPSAIVMGRLLRLGGRITF